MGAYNTIGYQAWGSRNPFVLVFLEWEGSYYHVDYSKWQVINPTPTMGVSHTQVRYEPSEILSSDASNQSDTRSVSGRSMIAAQPTFDRKAVVLQVLETYATDINLTAAQISDLKTNIGKTQFVSARLAGLNAHLLTRYEGSHVKSNVRVQGQKTVPLQAAMDAASVINFDATLLGAVDAASGQTP